MKTIQIFSEQKLPCVQLCASSMQGDRDYQQDTMSYFVNEGAVLAIVCDGMGGMKGGEEASSRAVHVMEECAKNRRKDQRICDFFRETAIKMDEAVAQLADENDNSLHAGTTATAVYVTENQLFWMSVGDSKLYLFREGEMLAVTQSHNYRLWLEKQSKSRQQETVQENKEALISYIGMNGLRMIDYNENPFFMKEGDIMLLCSDGLYKAMPEKEIRQILEACKEEFMLTAEVLTDAVREYGKHPIDNCTVLLLKYHKEDM